jgi:hypothetical protein
MLAKGPRQPALMASAVNQFMKERFVVVSSFLPVSVSSILFKSTKAGAGSSIIGTLSTSHCSTIEDVVVGQHEMRPLAVGIPRWAVSP